MSRKPKHNKDVPEITSWTEYRQAHGLPDSKRIRERGKCFDCGEALGGGACGGWHSRLEEERMKGFAVDFCCACAGHG